MRPLCGPLRRRTTNRIKEAPRTKADLRERAAQHAWEVSSKHFPELPVKTTEWKTSTRMQRAAEKAGYHKKTCEIFIRLSWDAYQDYGWEKFSRTVRHKLIHTT